MKKVIAVCLCLPLLGGCFMLPAEEEALPPPIVRNYEAKEEKSVMVWRGDLVNFKQIFANKTIMQRETLRFNMDGQRVAAIYVEAGDEVSKGDMIASLDCPSLLAQLSELRLKLRIAELEVSQLEESYALERRYSDAEGYSGAMEKAFVAAKNNISAIERSIEEKETDYEAWIIRAPFDGIITKLERINVGDTSSVTRDICTVEASGGNYFVVQGSNTTGLKPDAVVPIVINEIEYQAKVIKGSQVGYMYLEVIDAGDADFSEVKFASVRLVIQEVKDVLLLPVSAVLQGRTSKYVYRLVEGEKVFTEVTTGMEHNGYIEITSGLFEGDVVTARWL